MGTRAGTEIAGYRIESLLARGGMGEVYLASQSFPERKVALKLLPHDLAADASFRERFVRESNAAASLEHPNIVPVYGAGESGGELYIAMRYVEGTDLRRLLQDEGPLAPERATSICAQVADALDEAHEHGLIHRDVKPGNILIAKGDRAYLSDFGLIRRSEADTGITKTGEFMGTVDYVAPDQIRGEEVDGRADVYSLGCVLYECLAGEPPFVRETEVATLYAHLQDHPPKLTATRPELPPELDGVIAKAMAKRPQDRYTTATEFAEAARGVIAGPTPEGPAKGHKGLIGALVAGLVVIAGLALAVGLTAGGSTTTPTPKASPTLAPNQVVNFDPETGEVLRSAAPVSGSVVGVAGRLGGVAVGEGAVWAIDGTAGVAHIDPETGEIGRVGVGGGFGAYDIEVGGGAVWATGLMRLVRIDPATDEVRKQIGIGNAGPVAYGDRSIWARVEGPLASTLIMRVDAATNEQLAIVPLEQGVSVDDLAFGAGSLWVLDAWDGEVLRIDPERNEVADRIPVAGSLDEVAADDRGVWVLDTQAGLVTHINPTTLSVGDTYRVGTDPTDIQVGLGAVWIANHGDDTLSRIDPTFGSVETIDVRGPVVALAADEETGTLWLQLGEAPSA